MNRLFKLMSFAWGAPRRRKEPPSKDMAEVLMQKVDIEAVEITYQLYIRLKGSLQRLE